MIFRFMREIANHYSRKFKRMCNFPQKQLIRCVLYKRCVEKMQQIYKRAPMPKCDFSKVALQRYWNHSSEGVFSCKFAACFQNTFSKDDLWVAISEVPKLLAQLIKTITEKFLIEEEPERLQYFHIRRNWSIMKCYVRDVYMEWNTSPKWGISL